MAIVIEENSRTFGEYLLLPNHSSIDNRPDNVTLTAPVTKFKKGESAKISLNIPFVSAVMQAVSNDTLAVSLARAGGMSFIYHSQPIQEQAEMIRKTKSFRAGFVLSDSNLKPSATIADAINLSERTGHSHIAITSDGTANGTFLGILSKRDIPLDFTSSYECPVSDFMTSKSELNTGLSSISLEEAQKIIWEKKIDCLPILATDDRLQSLVFRRDFVELKSRPTELVDTENRLYVGAGINTRDYRERIPALKEAGADVFVIDSSDGHSDWQANVIKFAKERFGPDIKIGAGNIVDSEGFKFLVNQGADFIKVGIGGGSICITREQKGLGRGSASALMEVAKTRDEYFQTTGEYIPICVDGGVSSEHHMCVALALGADFIMMGRYFARFDESPGKLVNIKNRPMKEYWAEGSNRAANWARYDLGGESSLHFEEGVDGFVPYAGPLEKSLKISCDKIKSTMCNLGSNSLAELKVKARLVTISQHSARDTSYTVERKSQDFSQS